MHLRHRDLAALHQRADHTMKFLEHGLNLVGRVDSHINARREAALAAAQQHRGDFGMLVERLQGFQQFVHHLKINHVQRWMMKADARQRRMQFEGKAGCGGNCHVFSRE